MWLYTIGRPRRSPLGLDDVVLFGARRDRGERDVRNLEQHALKLLLDASQLAFQLRDLVAERAAERDQLVRALTRAFAFRDLLCIRVALRLSLVGGRDQRTAF